MGQEERTDLEDTEVQQDQLAKLDLEVNLVQKVLLENKEKEGTEDQRVLKV